MNTPLPPQASPGSVRTAILAAAFCLLLVGCSGSGGSGLDASADAASGAEGDRTQVVLITHGGHGDSFWDLVQKGARAAAAKDGIDLTYASDSDPAKQAQLVREAVDDRVDGIAVTLAKPQAMKSPVADAKAAGIPVVGLNSGIDAWRAQGLLEYFGQDESLAGRAIGERLNAVKAKHALCVIHERGNRPGGTLRRREEDVHRPDRDALRRGHGPGRGERRRHDPAAAEPLIDNRHRGRPSAPSPVGGAGLWRAKAPPSTSREPGRPSDGTTPHSNSHSRPIPAVDAVVAASPTTCGSACS
ncbi:hypothetical protein SALBM311S_03687 [Streptomyces alboniger]